MDTLTATRLKELLDYNPDTGEFKWRVSRCSMALAGDIAGSPRPQRRGKEISVIMVERKFYRAHRLAFLYMLGRFPKNEVDHINGNSIDNRWANLREASRQQNQCNVGPRRTCSSGFKGVHWDKINNRWRASIQHEGRVFNLGRYDKIEDAYAAYCDTARRLQGEFARVEQ